MAVDVVTMKKQEKLLVLFRFEPLQRPRNTLVHATELAFDVVIGVEALFVAETTANPCITGKAAGRVAVLLEHVGQRHQVGR